VGYRGKVAEQERARELRAQSWTLDEIAEELAVSKSSVSLWVRDVEFEPRGRATPYYRNGHPMRARKAADIEAARSAGLERIGELGERDLMIAGVMRYAGEGSKRAGSVVLANSDPRMIRLHLRWLRTFFAVEERRLRLRLYLHEGLDLGDAQKHWAALTGIPTDQHYKPYRAVADPSIRRAKHPMGCVGVVYHCARTHKQVMGLMDALLT
jgi:transcriptional regulator with XRE-family HTH domain